MNEEEEEEEEALMLERHLCTPLPFNDEGGGRERGGERERGERSDGIELLSSRLVGTTTAPLVKLKNSGP